MVHLASKTLCKARSVILKTFGYRPDMFWNFWAIDFDRDSEQVIMHPWNIEALKLINEVNPGTVLEVGCGFGRNMKELINTGFNPENLHGVDISKKMLAKCEKYLSPLPVKLQKANITSLPFTDNSIDVVYVSLVLMHVLRDNVGTGIREAIRVARRRIVFLEEYRPEENGISTKQINDYTFAHNYKTYLNEAGHRPSQWNVMDKWCVFAVDL